MDRGKTPQLPAHFGDFWNLSNDDDDIVAFQPKQQKNLMTATNKLDEIDQFVEKQRRAEETNLMTFTDDEEKSPSKTAGTNNNNSADSDCSIWEAVSHSKGSEWSPSTSTSSSVPRHNYRPEKLPSRAIIYDYTVQPIRTIEHKREYLACNDGWGTEKKITYPFLRPILIDGIGLIKSYRGCCSEHNLLPLQVNPWELSFPFMPIVRCLFYWISRGHPTVLCFSQQFNPICADIFNATDEQKRGIKMLEKYEMVEYIADSESKIWFDQKLETMRACLVTTVPHYLQGMPLNLDYSLNEDDICRLDRQRCPDRLLQPYHDHKGNTVFFVLFNTKNQCVDSIVLDDQINSEEEFNQVDKHQLSFVSQVLRLKLLYDLLPSDARVREANVMVEVFGRLKPFL